LSASGTERLISIIIPTRNRPESLRRALENIFRQSYKNFEVIVIDDGSELDICQAVKDHPMINVIRQEQAGPNAARNNGFAQSRGEFLLFCDDDVELEPRFLEKMVQALTSNPDKAYAYCGFKIDNEILGMEPFNPEKLRKKNYISGVSLIRRSKFPRFDVKIRRLQDWDLWLTMLKNGHQGIWVPEILFNTSSKNKPSISDDSNIDGWIYAYEVVINKHGLSDPWHSLMRFYARTIYRMAPDGTRRGDLRKVIVASLRLAGKEGVGSLFRRVWRR